MQQHEFPKLGTPGRERWPNFYDGPNKINADQEGIQVGAAVSETPTHVTVNYRVKDRESGDLELLRSQIKGTALFDDGLWGGMNAAAQRAFLRTALQKLAKYLFRGNP